MRKKEKMNVMVLPVSTSCNLSCKYCYHSNEVNRKISKMSDEILRKIIVEAAELASDIDFIWHGGEPLLAGRNFYKRALFFQNEARFSGKIRNIIQSNATLIDDDWADFLSENNFLVGTSIDGPRALHNACRVNKRNGGTFSGVVGGLKKIQERKKNVGCITLITTRNVNHPEEVFKTIRELKIPNLALHFCASTSSHNSDDFIPFQENVLRFLKKLFKLWTDADDPLFRIRNFVNVIRANNGAKALDCAHQADACKFFVAIDASGNVFPCHRFSHDLTK
ncbi:MAG: radical SAM protein, partial [Patescibacteria group bacterium]